MGLDMYLNKVKKVGDLKLKQILNIESYIDWLDRGQKYSLKDWCGLDENKVMKDYVDDVRKLMHRQKNPAWAWGGTDDYITDDEFVTDNIAYWRKANQIHRWFVENVQDGEDDCDVYRVKKKQLKALLETAEEVLNSCNLVKGKIKNGWAYKNGEEIPIIEDGEYIEDPTVAMELLPSTGGFFFGSTDYDQWYYDDIKYTVKQLKKVLNETDFKNEYVYYHASW